MPQDVLNSLKILFFKAEPAEVPMSPPRYCVRGYPDPADGPRDYDALKKPFHFIDYAEAVAAGLVRWKTMFGGFGQVQVHKLGRGRNLQWFKAQLCDVSHKVIVEGDEHYPAFTIDYTYDNPTFVKFGLGVYRSLCANGLIFDFNKLVNYRVKGKDLWELEPFLSCMWHVAMRHYDDGVKVLRRTNLSIEDIRALAEAHLGAGHASTARLRLHRHNLGVEPIQPIGRASEHYPSMERGHGDERVYGEHALRADRIADGRWFETEGQLFEDGLQGLVQKYVDEDTEVGVGRNAFAALNIVTDVASNYYLVGRATDFAHPLDATETVSKALFIAQEKAGTWFDELVQAIRAQNDVVRSTGFKKIEGDDFGEYPERPSYEFNVAKFLTKRKTQQK